MQPLIMIVEPGTRPGRQHVDWYRDLADQAARFPVLHAGRHGVSHSPAINPADIPDETWDLAEAVAVAIATDPNAALDHIVRGHAVTALTATH